MMKVKKQDDYLIYIINKEEFRIVQIADEMYMVRKFMNLKKYWWEKNMYDWFSLSSHTTLGGAFKFIEDYGKYPINH